MDNAASANHVLVFQRAENGQITSVGSVTTGGTGTGAGLSSQGAVLLSHDGHWLFVCNAGSDEISVFEITPGNLQLVDKISSGGRLPLSLTQHHNLLYVLNAGGPNRLNAGGTAVSPSPCGTGPNIAGFAVNPAGRMKFLPGSVQTINPGPTGGGAGVNCPTTIGFPAPKFDCGLNPPAFPRSPGQVGFTPGGDQLVVTVKGTNSIHVFPVSQGGTVGSPTVTQAPGPALPTYFGFAFDQREHLILSEPFGSSPTIPAPKTGAVSSFAITAAGTLNQISKSVADQGTAACWVAIDPITGKYAYVSNNGSASVSSSLACSRSRRWNFGGSRR